MFALQSSQIDCQRLHENYYRINKRNLMGIIHNKIDCLSLREHQHQINRPGKNQNENQQTLKLHLKFQLKICYGNQFTFFADYLINDMDNNGRWKNPYKSTGNRVQQPGWCTNAASGDANAGFVWINSRNGWDNVTVCTCIKTPCNSSDNRSENTIKLD